MSPAVVPSALRRLRPGTPEHEVAHAAPGRRAGTGWVLISATAAGVAGAVAMAVWLMFCAEVANDPTPVDGVTSSTWTPITAITSVLFGVDAFHAGFYPLSILFGLAAHLFFGVLFAIIGVALMTYTFAGRATIVGGAAFGLTYALVIEVLFRNVFVNWVQDVHTVADALPTWGWWVGHAFYGLTLGAVAAWLLSLGAAGVTPGGRLADEGPR